MISVNYGFHGSVMTVTNDKSLAESEKFTLKIKSESGKLFTIGCRFSLKSTNFGTLRCPSDSGGITPDWRAEPEVVIRVWIGIARVLEEVLANLFRDNTR